MFFTNKKIPILTVHDSIIIQSKYSELLNEIMWEEYKMVLKTKLKYIIKCNRIYPLARYVFKGLSNKYKSDVIPLFISRLKLKISDSTKDIVQIIFSGLNTSDIIGVKTTKAKASCSNRCLYTNRKMLFLNDKRVDIYRKIDWSTSIRELAA